MAELHRMPVRAQLRALRSGRISPAEAVRYYLERIDRLNPRLGALVEVTRDGASARAAAADELRSTPLRSTPLRSTPLAGLPFADKDLVARAGVPTRYGSRAFVGNVPVVSDELAAALDEAGGISLGKTNTPEFGLTGYTESRVAAPARDPWDPALGAGGSSGGAAVAVATGMLPWAPASDGGGSIRIPAATVGAVGLKPSRGRLPIGSGLDSVAGMVVAGAITRTVDDARVLLAIMTRLAARPYSVAAPDPDDRMPWHRIAVTFDSPWDDAEQIDLDPAARAAVERAAGALDAAGHGVDPLSWRPRGYPELFRILWKAGAARLPLDEPQLDLVEPITAWLVRSGRALPARELLGALGAAALFERRTIEEFAPFDAVLTPALAQSPRPIGWYDAEDAERSFVQQVQYSPYTSFVNVAGLPALVLPVHEDADGHPVAVQLIGRPGGERTLLDLGEQLERTLSPGRHPAGW